MKHSTYFFLTAALLLIMTSCVPNRKYTAVRDEKTAAEAKLRDSLNVLRDMRKGYLSEKSKNAELATAYQKIELSEREVKAAYEQTQRLNKDVRDMYDKLLEQNRELTRKAANDVQSLNENQSKLKAQLEAKEMQLERVEDNLKQREEAAKELERKLKEREDNIKNLQGDKGTLEKNLAEREKKVKELEDGLANREQRVKELEGILSAQKAKAAELKSKLTSALKNFEASELSVEERDGRVYVSLSQKLLFASGSSAIDKRGKEALASLASVLNKNTESSILVEGHTDSDGDDLPNWRLSADRAVTIVNELTKAKVDPKRITASGRGEHQPVAPNTTSEGKATNRRSEIILVPDLTELYKLINN